MYSLDTSSRFLLKSCEELKENADDIDVMAEKKASIGCLFWIILILLVLIIILINLKPAMEVMEKTGFFKAVEEILPNPSEVPEDVANKPQTEDQITPETTKERDTPEPEQTPVPTPTLKASNTPSPGPSEAPRKKNIRRAKLYYVQVTSQGELQLTSTTRSIYYDDSPLLETLLELFKGPDSEEINQGTISQIPRNTKLLNIYVKNKTAYIDLNEDFRINSLERKGHIAQLKQIIFTATEYPTVDWVQFLIQGKKVEYMGAEGVYIGEPLSRNSEIK